MRSIRQKLQIATALLLGLGLGVPLLIVPKALAASAGTCIIDTIQGQDAQKVVKCSTEMPSGKDSAGALVDPKKCYEVSEVRGAVTINQELSCTNSRLDGAKLVLCDNGAKAPNNDKSQCTSDTGTVYNCADGTPAPNNDQSKCTGKGDPAARAGNCSDPHNLKACDLIHNYIQPLVDGLAALVGVAVVISIVIGGIQYGSSGGDPQKVTAAKNRIRNAVLALITFFFLLALLNFLIPGGLV